MIKANLILLMRKMGIYKIVNEKGSMRGKEVMKENKGVVKGRETK